MCFLGPWSRNWRKLLIQYHYDASNSRSPLVAGFPVAVPCWIPKSAHIFLAERKKNDKTQPKQIRHPKLKEITPAISNCDTVRFRREYIISQNIIYTHIFQMVQSNCRSKLEDSWSFFMMPKSVHQENPLWKSTFQKLQVASVLINKCFITHSKCTMII